MPIVKTNKISYSKIRISAIKELQKLAISFQNSSIVSIQKVT